MNKSQNTKNEQQKDLCITSEQLTEQWKKGELPSGWYWVDYYSIDGAVMLEYIPQHNGFGYEEKELVQEVLAEVPDYVEWRNMVNCACEEHEANKRFIEENTKLKELLEECRHIIGIEKDFATCHFEEYTLVELLTKIDEVLNDRKYF